MRAVQTVEKVSRFDYRSKNSKKKQKKIQKFLFPIYMCVWVNNENSSFKGLIQEFKNEENERN